MNEAYEYVGSELELFRSAINWKQTLRRHIKPFVRGRVLEVGAGIGGTTSFFRTGREESWTCLEPDATLAATLVQNHPEVESIVGTVSDLPRDRRFDAILYIDVIEHIEDDREELMRASSHLEQGGYLIVLCPAHQMLFSPFDHAVGHYRRYSKSMYRSVCPSGMLERKMAYLDSVGLFASIANKLVLSQSIPTEKQILFWDRCLVRASRLTDWFLRYTVGKSVLGVWQKP